MASPRYVFDLLRQGFTALIQHEPLLAQWFTTPRRIFLKQHRSAALPFLEPLTDSSSSSKTKHSDRIKTLSDHLYQVFHLNNDSHLLTKEFGDVLAFKSAFDNTFGERAGVQSILPAATVSSSSSTNNNLILSEGQDVEVPFGLTPVFRTAKKERQVRRVAHIVQKLRRKSCAINVVDIGGGTGNLAELLAGDFGVPVVVLDQDARLLLKKTDADGSNNRKDHQYKKKLHQQEDRQVLLRRRNLKLSQQEKAQNRVIRSRDITRIAHRIDLKRCVELLHSSSNNRNVVDNDDYDDAKKKALMRQVFGRDLTRKSLSKQCCMIGVHACGSLSDSVLLAARTLNEVKSFLVIPCCPHKKIRGHVAFSDFLRKQKEERTSFLLEDPAMLLLANLNPSMTPEQFHRWVEMKVYHQALLLLFNPKNATGDDVLVQQHVLLGSEVEDVIVNLPPPPQQSSELARQMVVDSNQHCSLSCHFCSETTSSSTTTTTTTTTTSWSSFSEFVAAWLSACSPSSTKGKNTTSLLSLSQSSREKLDDFFDSVFGDDFSGEVCSAVALKCVVDFVASVVEPLLFLDRVAFVLEADCCSALAAGTVFPASTTPRRLGIWGVKKRAVGSTLLC